MPRDSIGPVASPAPVGSALVLRHSGPNPLLLRARFPKDLTTPEAIDQFVRICQVTGLNPFLGELIPIHGRLYVTEQGWLRLIEQRAPGQKVVDEAWLGTKEEAGSLGIRASGWLALAKVVRRLSSGIDVTHRDSAFLSATRVAHSDPHLLGIREEPWRFVTKTARVRCLRRAFPDVLLETGFQDLGAAEDPIEMALSEETGQGVPDQTTERRRFWARLRDHGIRHGDPALAQLLQLSSTEAGAIRQGWLTQRSWYDANERIDRLESLLHEGYALEAALATLAVEALPPTGGTDEVV